jgi:vacuolar protein sorting-associated protein 26
LFLSGYELTPSMRDINKKFSVRYYLNLVLVDEEERRYFKQQVGLQVSSSRCKTGIRRRVSEPASDLEGERERERD